MDNLASRRFAGVDIGRHSLQFSIYDEALEQMTEESFPIYDEALRENASGDSPAEGEILNKDMAEPGASLSYIEVGMHLLSLYMQANELDWDMFSDVVFSLEDASQANRDILMSCLSDCGRKAEQVRIITRFRAFVEYIFHQERAVWDRSILLLDYYEKKLTTIYVDQIRRSRERAYHAVLGEIALEEHEVDMGQADHDVAFARMIKYYLAQNPAHIVYLTGENFEGNWMKRTLNTLCAGRRVFMGQNLYANGACFLGVSTIPYMDEGMLLMDGPEMVYHTIGVIAQDGGRVQYVPITSIGQEWYNTTGSLDIILDKSQKVEFFYHNTKENEIECSVCEVKDLPARPPKTTRMRLSVRFSSATDGVILLQDLGFGSIFPATGKVTVFPFSLIS